MYIKDALNSADASERLEGVERRRPIDTIGLRPTNEDSFIELVDSLKIVDISIE